MLIPVPPTECMRARESASAQLDGELTELEATRLNAHLRDCGECRDFAAETAAFSVDLRQAPLEQPLGLTFVPPRRRFAQLPRLHSAAAAAVLALAVGSLLSQTVRDGEGPTSVGRPAATVSTRQLSSVDRWRELLAFLPQSDRQRIVRHVPQWAA